MLINALLAALIAVPSPGLLPEVMPTKKPVMVISARNRRRLIAAGKYLDLLT